jgi:hypothetical protein
MATWTARAADLSALRDSNGKHTPLGVEILEAIHGSDMKGQDGPLNKLVTDLILIDHEFQAFQAQEKQQRTGKTFRTVNSLVHVHNETIVIDAVAAGSARTLKQELEALGMHTTAVFGRNVSGILPIRAIGTAAGLASLHKARPAMMRTRAGSVTSQGDTAMQAAAARSASGADGTGVMVGTLSDSYDCTSGAGGAAGDVSTGDLPPGVSVLQEISSCDGAIDEGRAMMQIIHDVAPGSTQAFHSAFNGVADFASGIVELAVAGAGVINDDIIYYAEPMFQDGPIAQAVDTVKAMGVAYFSSAGNSARQSYESSFRNSGISGYRSGSVRHDFDAGSGVDVFQQITIPSGETAIFSFQWSDPHFSVSGSPGASSDLDIVLYSDRNRPRALVGSIDTNIGGDPVEVFGYTNTGPAQTFLLGIDLVAGPAPSTIKYVYFGNVTINEHDTSSGSAYGHAIAAGGQAVGAARYTLTPAFGTSPPVLESFSSRGGTPILFDTSGNAVYELRQKPEIVAPDGADTTFFFPGTDPEGNGFPNFFGTSAAAPHAAGVAALLRSFDPTLNPDSVYNALQTTALDMGASGVDLASGYGLIQVDAALATLDDDSDGVPDSSDLCAGTAPGDPVDSDGCSDFQKDTDGDGLSDGLEIQIGTDPQVDADADNDGLTDYQEVAWDGNDDGYNPASDTNPLLADTDNDGFRDGIESAADYDPLLATSFPVWGDINDDRVVNAVDVLLAMRAALGLVSLDVGQLARGNVAPLVDGSPQPPLVDTFDIADVFLIQRKALDAMLF